MITQFNNLLSGFTKYLESKGKQRATINSYKTDTKGFLSFLIENKCDYQKISHPHLYQHTKELRENKGESQNSIRRKTIGIRQFYQYLVAKKIMSSNPLLANAIPKRDESLPEELNLKHIRSFIKTAKKHPSPLKSIRDSAIIALLALEGLKVTEIVALKNSDLILTESKASLMIKGHRKRVVNLDHKTQKLLKDYHVQLKTRGLVKPSSSLFIALKGKEQEKTFEKITRHGMKFLLYEIGEEAGFNKLNTEILRHHAINYLLRKKKTLQAVQNHLGLKQGGNITKHINKNKLESHERFTTR